LPLHFSALSGLCESFNIDVKRPRIFSGPEDALFGFTVLQHEAGGEKSMLVGAPWDGPPNNRKGDVYRCMLGNERNSNCSKVNLGEAALQNLTRNLKNSHLGMTLTPDSPDGFLACAPLWSQECGTSVFSTGICASVADDMEPRETIAPTAQRCTTYMDIVIVLDGSNSIYPWYEVQNFLSNILSKFHISPEQMQVGVLQYGEISVHEWSLRDYQSTEEVVEAAKNISRQEGRETRTAYAIQMACTEAFSPERGAREGATKVMIVVTDGESHDGEELPEALAECEQRNITRYAIAVLGHYIRRQQDPETFINEIKYIASDPDEKYFFNVTDEAALNDIVDALGDRIFSLEGTLGYNKSSFVMEMSQIGFSTHILDDGILFGMVGAYDWEGGVSLWKGGNCLFHYTCLLCVVGYTVSSVTVGDWKRLYVAGAPRFKHKGKSSCLTSVSMGTTNFSPNGTLRSQPKAQDDGYADLLVGAPLEDNHQGALVCYHGDEFYIIPQYKQRIPGSTLSPGLQYFGRSVSSQIDLDGDDLLDLSVGAQGNAILLSSRSIVQINVSLSFQPHSINVIQKNCQQGGRESACVTAVACFITNSRFPHANRINFALLDDWKFSTRALFDKNSQRQTSDWVWVRVGETVCHDLPFHVFDTADYIRPISFSLRFEINDAESGPVLDEGWPTALKQFIPFFKDCGEDDICVTDLVLQAHMDISGTRQKPFVVRSPRRRLAVVVQLENRLENAYNTSLTLQYSRNLHFSSLSIRDETQVKIECTALSSNSHSCNVSYPVFRSQSKVSFRCLSLSCLEETLADNLVQLQTVVRYEPDLFITSESNLNRYEVHPTRTASEGTGPEFYTHFRLQNLGCYVVRNLELWVNLPSVAAGEGLFMSVVDVFSHNVRSSDTLLVVWPLILQNCSRSWCVEVVCQVQQLLGGQSALIRITRRVHDDFFRQVRREKQL
uniref:VWFA domain-containing protein n=1 Tax=Denticeps clupeoides TaxID=299321 RepID=A0AAY4C6Y6_9TELE